MLDSQIFLKKLLLMSLGMGLMTVFVTTAKADDQVTRIHTFDLENIQEVEFSNSVGSIEIQPVTGTEMRVVLDIEGKHPGFFRRQVDVDNMDIEVKERGDTLFLSFDEKGANAECVVEMPSVERVVIQMGVGELNLELTATDLDVDVEMGVGEVHVDAPTASVGRINVNVGVGDANIRGAEILNRKSAFISQRIRAQGEGTHALEIDLGVGDINIRLD